MLEPKTLEIVALVAAGVALLAVVVATVAVYQIWSIRRRVLLLQKDSQGDSFIDVVAHKVTEVQGLRADVQALRSDVAVLRTEVRDALRHVAVIRYDAFGDLGGRLSFSAAVIDDNGDGFVLTSIHGRSDTRVYLKGVQGASAEHVSPEETAAISHAAKGARQLNL